MPKQIVTKEEVIANLVSCFREYGYEGTSLSKLAELTGLSKASLYHYFKNGKDEMVLTAFAYLNKAITEQLYDLADSDMDASKKFDRLLKAMTELYEGGAKNCVVGIFNSAGANGIFQKGLEEITELMTKSIARSLEDLCYSKKEAQKEAEFIFIQIQGALVVARAKNDNKVFTDTMKRIKKTVLD